ncbi:MAG TPA: hypothetical protein VNT51_03685 [Miltoncostaeaceae bacterium]|nr:hypothetical protein [Miltoncostaeaceae bacterium]
MTVRRPAVWAMLAVLALAAATVCALAPDVPALRLPAALALALWLPGHALVELLGLAGRDRVRTLTLALGASLAIALIVAVELAAFGVLAAETWAATTAAACFAASLAVSHRHAALGPATRVAPGPPRPRHLALAALAVTAVAAVGTAVVLARTPLPVPDDRGYTVLAVAPTASGSGAVTVRATSEEATSRSYVMRVSFGGRVAEERALTLEPGETSEQRVSVPPDAAGPLVVSLLDTARIPPVPYRSVRVADPRRIEVVS